MNELSLSKFENLKSLSGPILITGHTGFKGTWSTLFLQSMGIEVVGLALEADKESLFVRMERNGSIPEVIGNINDLDVVKSALQHFKPSAILHLAAQPLVLESYRDPVGTFQTNIIGTANILDAATNDERVKIIASVTTDKVYKNNNSGRPFQENDVLWGKDPYSASKTGSELAIDVWRNIAEVRNRDVKILSLRSGNVVGGGDYARDRLLPDLVRSVIFSKQISIRNPNSTRPWMHVADSIHGYLLAMEHALLQENYLPTFNFGPNGNSLTVREVVQIAIQTLGIGKELISFQEGGSQIESVLLELDSDRSRRVLGWQPQWDQSAAVESTLEWWKRSLSKEKFQASESIEHEITELLRNAR